MTLRTHRPVPHSSIAVLAVVTGTLMAAYLSIRPYGDGGGAESLAAAEAFASPLWVWSHLAGAGALVASAALWSSLASARVGLVAALGAALVLPYYGTETFALHAIGQRALDDAPGALELVPTVRNDPTAMALFGVGLLALASAGLASALGWRRTHGRGPVAGAFLPLAVLAALFLPQFLLPPVGRIAYGVLFAAAAGYAAYTLTTFRGAAATHGPRAFRVPGI
ncbi:hypothetical protein [Dietzia massiliensis]|uniref:hypothetical protein n=1 Tax=Dietzia massiliensis TaxID=2697499 RepID=UPI001BCF4A9F|nr:hypothetical protein [Dietzia massiliensis]MBS7546702.1 hypothetical protein [Dietzia massiliensis]